MKKYDVNLDITVSLTIEVDAENEEKAERVALDKFDREQQFHLSHYDSILEREVTEVNECDEPTDFERALAYVREQLGPETLAVIKAQVDRSYSYHMAPSNCVTEDGKVIDLLEEWGEDNDMPEGWWENEGDIDDILLKL